MNRSDRADWPQATNIPKIEFGGCWYHDAAMAEALEKNKH